MKIIYITSEKLPVPPALGGAVETWIYKVAQSIGEKVWSLCMFVPQIKEWPEPLKFNLLTFNENWLSRLLLCTYKLPFKNEKTFLYYYPYSRWCAEVAKRLQADIIHNHCRPQFIPITRKLNPKAKHILHVHNVSNVDLDGTLWPQTLMDQIDYVATCSDYLKKEVLKRYPYLAEKIITLYNGVDINRFAPQAVKDEQVASIRNTLGIEVDEQVILYSGRLVEYKGVHLLIEAFKQLLKQFPRTRLIIVGGLTYSNNEETQYIRELKTAAEKLGDRVIFTGYVPHEKTPAFIKISDLVIVPSLWDEPFGVVVIEAMAMEKCVVAFPRGGIPEIITHHENGWLVSEADAQHLGEAMIHLMSNSSVRQQLSEKARQRVVERFSWDRIVEDTRTLYQRLLQHA
jgi:spore coat protein SA